MDSTLLERFRLQRADTSYRSIPRPGAVLTGKQEHYLKRELIGHQVRDEIGELNSPTALRRFGAPFKGDKGEVVPQDSELPLLRYLFVHHVRTFPFLDQAREQEFWQDRVQLFLESFATKQISSSEDRLEDTKRKKLAKKAEKLVEIMMVSGIPTASGYEERIRFAELEVVDRGAQENGLIANTPQGHFINGWDVNVAGVRMHTTKKRFNRSATEGEYIIRVKAGESPEHFVVRRYEDFKDMHDKLRLELAGKVLPPLPKKNSTDYVMPSFMDDASSLSSFESDEMVPMEKLRGKLAAEDSTSAIPSTDSTSSLTFYDAKENPSSDKLKPLGMRDRVKNKVHHRRNRSSVSIKPGHSPRTSMDQGSPPVLFREAQRVSLRAALRTLLQNQHIARSTSMQEFLIKDKVTLDPAELGDIEKRKTIDEKRILEQTKFYEIAQRRAAEVDVHMERFRRQIIESNGLRSLFASIKQKNSIAKLPPEHKKVAEWLRIEIAATIYHLFLAEDNSAELFAQLKRIHSLFPYAIVKNIVRFANPIALFPRILDVFMAQPFGSRSLLQHIFGMAIQDGVNNVQKSITILITQKIQDADFPARIQKYVELDEDIKSEVKFEAKAKNIDLVLEILQSPRVGDVLSHDQLSVATGAHSAWKGAVENVGSEHTADAELFAHMKQLLKLYLRQRDKVKMLEIINEPNTIKLLRNLLEIFYEPIMRVIKSANVYNSVTDLSSFIDDIIKTVEEAQRQGFSADPNQTVQAFIDLCARHEDDFYQFVHEMHKHDNGLFDALMGHIEGILAFLRSGPKGGALDMNVLFKEAIENGVVDQIRATREVNSLIKWQIKRKRWHQEKTKLKMAEATSAGEAPRNMPGFSAIRPSDFGVDEEDLSDLEESIESWSSGESEDEDGSDGILAEQKRRARQARLRSGAGEPPKPPINELNKLMPGFLNGLREVLAE
ncbi:PX domain protein [Tothia fuscella]|uniref:PX domain protein n=1 Tax=Tothia fuscella TaxID=1048955 RepID=A0A9P4TRA2_9PEZI|nr:PX domain protein [Tothia fuscella]